MQVSPLFHWPEVHDSTGENMISNAHSEWEALAKPEEWNNNVTTRMTKSLHDGQHISMQDTAKQTRLRSKNRNLVWNYPIILECSPRGEGYAKATL